MYNINELLSRISRDAGEQAMSLASLQHLSIAEIRNRFRSALSFSEARYLFQEAAEQQKKNKLLESRIFTRANPQLPQASAPVSGIMPPPAATTACLAPAPLHS
ncbi:hypothetical protein HZZ08_24010 [Serratia marcescens]|nr:hypothetical protein HZZ08_24010 [Serratia marcescens]QLJ28826.1 hypothetical protein HZZ07_21035 [Serratia marcescens]QLJ29774.1 hypothetical protein HZZ06_00640 [Serratia marcescens]